MINFIELTDYQMASVFILMLFFHVVDDYYLQGCLSELKQKDWWKNQKGYTEFYKDDYIIALICHATSWSFMINLPWLILTKGNSNAYIILFMGNLIIHAIVDDLKANQKMINLKQDQAIHLFQVFTTWAAYIMIYC